jgi:hypothetical protein
MEIQKKKRFPGLKTFFFLWSKYQWPLALILTIFTVYIGYVGFSRYFAAAGQKRSFWDLLYLSLQLFTLESGSAPGPKTWYLEVARLLAPSLAAYAAIKALMAIFRDQVRSMRLWFVRDHAVICGLGKKGLLLAKGFRDLGVKVVVVEKNEENDALEQCRKLGAIPVIGDATKREIMEKARIERARYLVSVCGDDGANAEAALHAFEFAPNRAGRAISCFAHIVNPQLCHFLREQEFVTRKSEFFRLEFFNVFDAGARALLREFPPFGDNSSFQFSGPQIIIAGLGRMGQSLVVHAARAWRQSFRAAGKPLRVTLIDREAEKKAQLLKLLYPQLGRICHLVACQMDVRWPEFQEAKFLLDEDGCCRAKIIYICFDDDSLGLASALTLHRKIGEKDIPIVVRISQEAGLSKLISQTEGGWGSFENIRSFDLLQKTCRPEVVLSGLNETIARGLHEAYIRHQRKLGYTLKDNPSMVPWEELPAYLQEANRQQANHVGVKLRAVGCRVCLLTDWDAELFQFSPEEVELMARMEHERWMNELQAHGWKYGPGKKNEMKKTHPHLVPWESLPEDIKEFDRNFIQELPRILAEVDLEIHRLQR